MTDEAEDILLGRAGEQKAEKDVPPNDSSKNIIKTVYHNPLTLDIETVHNGTCEISVERLTHDSLDDILESKHLDVVDQERVQLERLTRAYSAAWDDDAEMFHLRLDTHTGQLVVPLNQTHLDDVVIAELVDDGEEITEDAKRIEAQIDRELFELEFADLYLKDGLDNAVTVYAKQDPELYALLGADDKTLVEKVKTADEMLGLRDDLVTLAVTIALFSAVIIPLDVSPIVTTFWISAVIVFVTVPVLYVMRPRLLTVTMPTYEKLFDFCLGPSSDSRTNE